MNILVTGVNGQVGFELMQRLSGLGNVVGLDRTQFDLTDEAAMIEQLNVIQPQIIVNSAAYTAVDKAESEKDLAFKVNAEAPKVLASWAKKCNALLIHYSTDYVFDGQSKSTYTEDSITNPQSVYGSSKLLGEQHIVASGCRYLILRTSWVYGVHGNNFIKTILRLAKDRDRLTIVADQQGTPTAAHRIAEITADLVALYQSTQVQGAKWEGEGLYHLTAGGSSNWCEYARYILQKAHESGYPLQARVEGVVGITTAEYPTPAKRPANSVLNCDKLDLLLKKARPSWQQDVDLVLEQLL